MDEFETQHFLEWVTENLAGVEVQDVDESIHVYYKGSLIGGFAGDTRTYFVDMKSETYQRAVRMYQMDNRTTHQDIFQAVAQEMSEEDHYDYDEDLLH